MRSGSPSTRSAFATADKLAVEDTALHAKAADNILADMSLLRELLLEAIGPSTTKDGVIPHSASRERVTSCNDLLDGSPQLSQDVVTLLKAIEALPEEKVGITPIAALVSSMSPEILLSSAQLFGELIGQANLASSVQTIRSWKANLRADAGFQVDRSAGAVVGIPTFRSAFDSLFAKGHSAERIRDAIVGQHIELVMTAHPTEAQRRTILKKNQQIVELLAQYDKNELLTPGEISDLKDGLRAEQVAAWRTSNVRRSKPSPEGEARNGMMVIEETCWDAVPEHYRRLDRSLARIGQPPIPYDACLVSIST